jgi:hypothetical protein
VYVICITLVGVLLCRDYDGVGDADYIDFDSIPFSTTSQASPAVQSNPVHRRFPSPEDCDKAFVHVVPGDGNCLFASLLEAAYSIGGVISEPGVSVSSLRLTVMRYIEDNRNHDVLPVISLDDEASALVSPESHLRGQMPGRLAQTADCSLIPCSSCLADASNKSKRHCCGGIPFGEIIIMGSNTPSYYTSFETYIRLMSQDKAFRVSNDVHHLQKYAYDASGNKLVWPFAQHHIAPYYAHDIHLRQALLGQSAVFLKQHESGDSEIPSTREELLEALQDPVRSANILKLLNRYAGNCLGTNGYWSC